MTEQNCPKLKGESKIFIIRYGVDAEWPKVGRSRGLINIKRKKSWRGPLSFRKFLSILKVPLRARNFSLTIRGILTSGINIEIDPKSVSPGKVE